MSDWSRFDQPQASSVFGPVKSGDSFFKLLFERVTDAVFLIEVGAGNVFTFMLINPAFSEITGVPLDMVVGKRVSDIIPEPSLTLVLGKYQEAIETRATVRWTEVSDYPTGQKHGEVSVTPVFDDRGRCTNLLGVVRDITPQKENEAKLARSTELLEKAQQVAHMGFLDWDLKTNALHCSDEVYRWYGITREAAPQTPEFVAKVVHPDDLAFASGRLESAIKGESEYNIDHRILRPDGQVLWVHAQAELVKDENGVPIRLLGTMVDITKRKQAEFEVSQLNGILEQRVSERTAQLEAVNQELAAFSYSVSHDLRAPLRHVNGYIDLLRRELQENLSDKAQRYLKTISDASSEMGQLIDDLLTFSRMGRVEMEERVFPLNPLVNTCVRELEPEMRNRRINWVIPTLPKVLGDSSMIKLVLTNLLANALKFTRPRAEARIELGVLPPEAGWVGLFVKDNGVGFDMQYVHKLFGVFQRLHRADEFEGTGIGLANVQRIVTRHGGRVWAEGAVNEGATFYFTLKIEEATA